MKTECKASSSEEPGAGIPHAGICAGGARQRASLPRYLVTNHPAAVAGDSETQFNIELTDPGTYTLDLWGGEIRTRASHRITFVFDGNDIDAIGDGANKLVGFAADATALTLRTVPIYIDPDGFDPPDDSNDGYIVQMEYGTSGRITLADYATFANGGRAGVVINGYHYLIHYYNDRDSLGQQFTINNGVVTEEVGLIDEGLTTDALGGEMGDTHQLVRLNRTSIHINLNGLSHSVVLGDNDSASFPMHNLPAGYNGSSEVLIHTDFGHTGYKFEYTDRLKRMVFDVDASGMIIDLHDPRAFASGYTITFNTALIAIDVPPETAYSVIAKLSPVSANRTPLVAGLVDYQELRLLPIKDIDLGVYFLGGNATDARDAFRIVYDAEDKRFSLTTWSDSAGTLPLEGQQSITLAVGYTVRIVDPTLQTVILIR